MCSTPTIKKTLKCQIEQLRLIEHKVKPQWFFTANGLAYAYKSGLEEARDKQHGTRNTAVSKRARFTTAPGVTCK